MSWKINEVCKRPKLNKPILIEGLPGIGNVGKITVDFMIEELKAKKYCDIFSYTFPHSVFVNEKNLVELPSIELYYKKFGDKRRDLLLLAGDVQPIDETSSYEFSDKMLDLLQTFNGKEVITLGGIGLQSIPKNPKIYCTGNEPNIIKRFKKGTKINNKLYGVVGPIIGVSGLLLGMAGKRDIPAIALLAETFGHPMFLGIKGAKEILQILDNKLSLKLNLDRLEQEIRDLESDMLKKSDELTKVSRQTAMKKMRKRFRTDMDYIG